MQLCNDTITVYNAYLDTERDYDVYVGTVITGVSWYCEIASNVTDSGLKAANKYTIRIPQDAGFGGKSYVDPMDYPDCDTSRCFTLRNGDIVVHGAVLQNNPRPAALQAEYETVTILGVTDNRRAPNAPHWKVVGA